MEERRTAFQKIVNSHLMRIEDDGTMVLKLDKVWGHEITSPNAFLDMEEKGINAIFKIPNLLYNLIL